MSYYTLALSSSNHDSCITLVKDNDILVSWPCERTSRDKHTQRIKQCDIDIIKSYAKYVDQVILVNMLDDNLKDTLSHDTSKLPKPNAFEVSESVSSVKNMLAVAGIKCGKFVFDNSHHHLYHAASGFYTSGFEESLCIVIDGIGSGWVWDNAMLSETTTIFYIKDTFTTLYKNLQYKASGHGLTGWSTETVSRVKKLFNYPVSISPHVDAGKMYGTVTRHIGFRSSVNAGKTMGLAAYGQPNNLPKMLIEGTCISDANLFRNDSQINTFLYPELESMSEQVKRNIAYNVQKAIETIFVKRVEQALKLKRCSNLILGGGCSLNILANSVVKKAFPNLNIFVEPIAADSTQSLGAALYHHKLANPDVKYNKLNALYLGPEYDILDVKSSLMQLVEHYNGSVV